MSRLRIAVTQPTASGDARRNGRVVADLMRQAADQQARLIHFPEGFLSGYAKEHIVDWSQVDWDATRVELQQIAALAADLRLWVVLGSAHPLTAGHRPHNSIYVLSDQGQLIDRYDKRFCSHTEISYFYSPGFRPVVFNVDDYRFDIAVCIEINFPEVFTEYEQAGVDCLLLSAYPVDEIFAVKAQALAAINNYWLSLSVPDQTRHLMPSGLIGPDGTHIARTGPGSALVIADLDRTDSDLHVALHLARPWRARARQGDIYRTQQVNDPRSTAHTSF